MKIDASFVALFSHVLASILRPAFSSCPEGMLLLTNVRPHYIRFLPLFLGGWLFAKTFLFQLKWGVRCCYDWESSDSSVQLKFQEKKPSVAHKSVTGEAALFQPAALWGFTLCGFWFSFLFRTEVCVFLCCMQAAELRGDIFN